MAPVPPQKGDWVDWDWGIARGSGLGTACGVAAGQMSAFCTSWRKSFVVFFSSLKSVAVIVCLYFGAPQQLILDLLSIDPSLIG